MKKKQIIFITIFAFIFLFLINNCPINKDSNEQEIKEIKVVGVYYGEMLHDANFFDPNITNPWELTPNEQLGYFLGIKIQPDKVLLDKKSEYPSQNHVNFSKLCSLGQNDNNRIISGPYGGIKYREDLYEDCSYIVKIENPYDPTSDSGRLLYFNTSYDLYYIETCVDCEAYGGTGNVN